MQPSAGAPQPAGAPGVAAPAVKLKTPEIKPEPVRKVNQHSEQYYNTKTTIFNALIDTIDLSQLAQLDTESAREEIRDILQRLGQTALLVTHDPEDALAIASRVVIIDGGNLMQTGTPAEVYRYPANQYCAERFGPANRVLDHATGKETWKRPEDARWIPCDVANEGDPVVIEAIREMGAIYEVRVAPGTQPGEIWLCFLKEGEILKPGDHGRVAWRGTPERVAWKS